MSIDCYRVLLPVLAVLIGHSADAQLSIGPDATVLKNEKPYRAVGVNYFNCFHRTLSNPSDQSYEEGFATLAEKQIPFARFCCAGYWPNELRLYRDNPAEYLRRLDGVVNSAEKNGVGLIPSLFWYFACVPDLVGEPIDQWASPSSKTQQFMRDYVRDVVTRYRNRPVIWAWEFGNEYALEASLPNAQDHRAAVAPGLGTAERRTERDDLTFEMVRSAYVAFGVEVRRHDPNRLIISGDSFPRVAAWHLRQSGSWARDTPEQFREILAHVTPDPLTCVSGHAYTDDDFVRLADAMKVSRSLNKPLFVGEFGPPGDSEERTALCQKQLDTILEQQVPLAALWVFDYPQQKDLNVTAVNERRQWLELISTANRTLRQHNP